MSDTITANQADDIILELRTIRKLLEAQAEERKNAPAPAPAATSTPSARTGGGKFDDEPIPQPSQIIPNAGDVQIHFGKNNGVALSAISERSLSWYATDQPARLDRQGKPFPPRPQEILLKNAARTLWHQLRGTLSSGIPQGRAPAPAATPEPAATSSNLSDEENVPF